MRVMAGILDIERVGIRDSFFALGGDSLSAIRLASRIQDVFRVELPVVKIYELDNVANLALEIQRQQESFPLVPSRR